MSPEIADATRRFEAFERRHSPEGLLREYARGRLRFYWTRKLLSFIIIGVIAYNTTMLTVAVIAVLLMLSDLLDTNVLSALRGRRLQFIPQKTLVILSTFTAQFQAATISLGVVVLVHATPDHDATPLALAYLMTASVYAGMFWNYHKPVAVGNLLIFAFTGCYIVFDGMAGHNAGRAPVADLIALLVMAFVSVTFIRFFNETFLRQYKSKQMILRSSLEIAKASSDLLEQQRENRRLVQVAEHANDSIFICDDKGEIVWVNDAFTRMNGYQRHEVIGKTPCDVLDTPDKCAEADAAFRTLQDGAQPLRSQFLNHTKDGRAFWISMNRVPIFGEDGKLESSIVIARDISDFKEKEAFLARAKEAAEEAAQAKARFLATMSHEIRTPMSAIIGMVDLLSEQELPAEGRKMLDTMRRSGETLSTIINDVLDFSKLDAGKVELSPVPFDPREVVDDVLSLLGHEARVRGLSLKMEVELAVPERVNGDDVRLRQILFNIIGNAIKFTKTGGVNVKIHAPTPVPDAPERAAGAPAAKPGQPPARQPAREPARQPGQGEKVNLSIRVQDSGIGIPADRFERVFEEFGQADNATTRQFGGTGLGLPISRLLARAMGGDIAISSTVGQGSTFVVTVVVETLASAVKTIGPALPETAVLGGMHVLVTDDNATNRMILGKFLAELPITLSYAKNGEEAVEAVTRDAPDFVLMDMSMPRMDGLSATRVIRARNGPQPRIIALTANAFASDKDACFEAGMDGFLAKPFRKTELLSLLIKLAPALRQTAVRSRRA